MNNNLDFVSCDFNDSHLMMQLVNLQNEVYKERGLHFTEESFRFWYLMNPEGRAISFNAFDNGVMVAHQSFVPERMQIGKEIVRCLRSMAVVTHPNYRGQGIFSQLTNAAVEEAKRQGYDLIYAITNGNSLTSFIKHCGFTFVAQLNVKIGYCGDIMKNGEKVFQRYWTKEVLDWRLSRSDYYRSGCSIYGTYSHGFKTYMGICDCEMVGQLGCIEKKRTLYPCIYVGLGGKLPFTLFDVPKFVKHSPFNLIYRDLTEGELPKMTIDNVFYQLIDFDVA